jgi:hypothetical protein
MKPSRGAPPTLTEVLDVEQAPAAEPPLPPTTESMPLELGEPRAGHRASDGPTLLDAQIEARVRAAVAALMPAWQEALVRAVTAAMSAELRAKRPDEKPPPIG